MARVPAPEVRAHHVTAVGDRRHHHRGLERRDQERALTDRDRDRLAGEPHGAALAQAPLAIGNEPRLLAGQIDAGQVAQPEPARPARDRIDREPRPQVVEVDVARLRDRAPHVDATVPALFPAAEPVVEDARRAAARHRVGGIDALLERRDRGHDLEHRAGRIGVLHRPVLQRLVRRVDDARANRCDRAGARTRWG